MGSRKLVPAAFACVCFVAVSGCHKAAQIDSNLAYKSAINSYYTAHPACLWSSTIKFPTEADPGDNDKSKQYDALTDAGLLTRSAAQKKRFLIGSKEVAQYDLSDKGRSQWQADQTQPGYGNFCYGHRDVSSIDSATPATQNGATQATVNYHYDFAGVPDWAKTTEMKSAFSNVAQNLAGPQAGTATLVQTQNGWQVSSAGTSTSLPQ